MRLVDSRCAYVVGVAGKAAPRSVKFRADDCVDEGIGALLGEMGYEGGMHRALGVGGGIPTVGGKARNMFYGLRFLVERSRKRPPMGSSFGGLG